MSCGPAAAPLPPPPLPLPLPPLPLSRPLPLPLPMLPLPLPLPLPALCRWCRHDIGAVMRGDLDEFIAALREADTNDKLAAM